MESSAVTEQVAEVAEAAEVVSQAATELSDAVQNIAQIKTTYALLGSAAGLAVGALIGFKVAYKKADLKYQKIAEEEISQMRDHYREKTKVAEPKPDLKEVVTDLGYATREVPEEYSPIVTKPDIEPELVPPTEVKNRNVFQENFRGLQTDVWDYEKELRSRTPEVPFVIHKEEFQEGVQSEDHNQSTLTYFIQDDVLIDEADQQIREIDETVGLENLEKFGHGSEDANVVYVRNHRLKMDYEILRNGGSYASEVLGIKEDGLEHSAMRRHRSRRGYDDD